MNLTAHLLFGFLRGSPLGFAKLIAIKFSSAFAILYVQDVHLSCPRVFAVSHRRNDFLCEYVQIINFHMALLRSRAWAGGNPPAQPAYAFTRNAQQWYP